MSQISQWILSKKNYQHYNSKKIPMTEAAVQAQVDIINRATQMALKSKDAAKKFLADAGIIQQEKEKTQRNQPSKSRK